MAVALVPNAPHNNTDIGTVRDVDQLDPIVGGASAVLLSTGLVMIFIGAQQVPVERRRLCLAPWASRKVGGLSLRLEL